MTQITITRALSELKTLQARIESHKLSEYPSVLEEVRIGHASTKEDVKKAGQSFIDKFVFQVDRREKLKAAIVASNAVTKVTIGGKTMTVAAAVELKAISPIVRSAIHANVHHLRSMLLDVSRRNAKAEAGIETIVASLVGKDGDVQSDLVARVSDEYRNSRLVELKDPAGVEDFLESRLRELDEFLAEVDYVLSISNAVTLIDDV